MPVAIVTGANTGIGLAAAKEFVAQDFTTVLACRNRQKADAARAEILDTHPDADVQVMSIDQASLAHVRRFADEVTQRWGAVNVLVNNAGASPLRPEITEDGFEMQFGANYLAPFLLTHLLLPRLVVGAAETGDSRVVHLASVAHNIGRMRESTWRGRKPYFTLTAYGQSKMGNLMFNYALARRLPTGVSTFAVHPGSVDSDIWRDTPTPVYWALKPTFVTTDVPGRLISDIATADEYRGRSGDYLTVQKPNPVRGYARNTANQEALYLRSCELVGIDPLPLTVG